jgi:hypothetical protein
MIFHQDLLSPHAARETRPTWIIRLQTLARDMRWFFRFCWFAVTGWHKPLSFLTLETTATLASYFNPLGVFCFVLFFCFNITLRVSVQIHRTWNFCSPISHHEDTKLNFSTISPHNSFSSSMNYCWRYSSLMYITLAHWLWLEGS